MFRFDDLRVTRTTDGRRVLLVDLDAVDELDEAEVDELDWPAIVQCARTIRALDDAMLAEDYTVAERLVWSLHDHWGLLEEVESFMAMFAAADSAIERWRATV